MKSILGLALIMSSMAVGAQTLAATNAANPSPAERAVTDAKRSTAAKPDVFAGYNQLALALVRRGQETVDSSYYDQAREAVQKSLSLAPDNFETKKVEVALLLAEHEYPAALAEATVLNEQVPDDVTLYGLLTDADMELGKYQDAEKAAQWMLNLRPGNVPALTRAAHLRELFGDPEGSAELLNTVLDSTAPSDAAGRADILTQLGHLRLAVDDADGAERFLQQALQVYPNYGDALESLAAVRSAQKRYDEAASLLQQSYAAAPRTERLYLLGNALAKGKLSTSAEKTFTQFERVAATKVQQRINSNVPLVFYYADHEQMRGKALEVATRDYSWRRDVYTLDAYAWALHVNAKDEEARKQVEAALSVGIQDPSIFSHAGEIALKLGDQASAERYMKRSRDLSFPNSEPVLRPQAAERSGDLEANQ